MINKQKLVAVSLGAFMVLGAFPAISKELVIPVDVQNKIIGVRVADLVSSYPTIVPGLANLSEALRKSPESSC